MAGATQSHPQAATGKRLGTAVALLWFPARAPRRFGAAPLGSGSRAAPGGFLPARGPAGTDGCHGSFLLRPPLRAALFLGFLKGGNGSGGLEEEDFVAKT